MATAYTRIVYRFEKIAEAQRDAQEHGCILQHNLLCPDQFFIAPTLLPDFEPVHTAHKEQPRVQ